MFKKRKKRKLRQKIVETEEDNNIVKETNHATTIHTKLKNIVEQQKNRKFKRSHRGLNTEELDSSRNNNHNNDEYDNNNNDVSDHYSMSASNSKSKFTTASLSIDNIGNKNDVTDEKFMEYYNNNLKSEDGNNDNNNKKKNANHLDANGNNDKEAKQLIDTSMAMAEVALPQKYNVQNVKNIMKALQQKRQDNQLNHVTMSSTITNINNNKNTKKRNHNFFQQERRIKISNGYKNNNNNNNNNGKDGSSSRRYYNKNGRTDSSVLKSFKEYESRIKRNR